MSHYCDKLQQRLGIEGLTVVKGDQNVQDHLAECEECFAVFEAIGQLDPLLKALPIHDASDELVDQTVNAVKEAGFEPQVMDKPVRSWSRIPNQLLMGLIAISRSISTLLFRFSRQQALIASSIVVLSIASIIFLDRELKPTFDTVDRQMAKLPESTLDVTRSYSEKASSDISRPVDKPKMPAEQLTRGKTQPAKSPKATAVKNGVEHSEEYSDLIIALQNDIEVDKLDRSFENEDIPPQPMGDYRYSYEGGISGNDNSQLSESSIFGKELSASDDEVLNTEITLYDPQWRLGKDGVVESNRPTPESVEMRIRRRGLKIEAQGFLDEIAKGRLYIIDKQIKSGETNEYKKQAHWSDARTNKFGRNGALREQEKVRRELQLLKSKQAREDRDGDRKKAIDKLNSNQPGLASVTEEKFSQLNSTKTSSHRRSNRLSPIGQKEKKKRLINNSAERFLAARLNTDMLRFKQAAGYWANNYVPGDATLRRLHTALLGKSLQSLEQSVGQKLRLHDGAHQTSQPFDLPEHAALAVYLHADQTGLQGKRRMLMQVGLQSSSRRSGSRPAMNVGVVFDLRGKLDKQTSTRMRSLLFALNKARDIGDRFSLVLAGKPGRVVVGPDEFRHGPLMVAMQNIEQASSTNSGLNLTEAIKTAIAQVSSTDDPTAPLGSSVVLLVTNQTLGNSLSRIVTVAHQSAVAGIPMSTIAAGPNAVVKELDTIALAGQGTRRVLDSATDANKLIRKELSAVSEVVARAVRLRIRLAAGVKLVNVIGSFRLDEVRADRVRQAEQSIDRRLSRNLGIQSDRGEDEEGIQIVIPAFYADTSHVVLLDVVAMGPGAVADVTVRYKDLVQLKNGVARANLSLGRSESATGPLERNVTKNFLAFRLSQSLTVASKLLANDKPEKGELLIREQLALLESFRDIVPGFDRDPDILADITMLREYSSVMQIRAYQVQPEEFIDSLAFAAKMKVLPRPDSP